MAVGFRQTVRICTQARTVTIAPLWSDRAGEAARVANAADGRLICQAQAGKPGSLWQWPGNMLAFLFRLLAGHGDRPAQTSRRMISVWIFSSFAFYAVSNAGYSGTSSAVIAPLAVQGHIRLSYMP
jgi:hypothetical protein